MKKQLFTITVTLSTMLGFSGCTGNVTEETTAATTEATTSTTVSPPETTVATQSTAQTSPETTAPPPSTNKDSETKTEVSITDGIPITDDYFPSVLFQAEIIKYDLDGNRFLSQEECSQVKELYLPARVYTTSPMVISPFDDLKGIEYFENLEKLVCSDNSLKKLDLHYFPNLRYLDCSGNQLSALDLSNNPMLTELYCEKNELTSLDLSKNQSLKILSCSQNQLTSLDLSRSQDLELANVVTNSLTDLNIVGLAHLRGFECWDNPLTDIDASGCTSLAYFSVDSMASIHGMIESTSVTKRYDPSVLKDGYYYTEISASGILLDALPRSIYASPHFINVEVEQGMLTIEGWLSEDSSTMDPWVDEETYQKICDYGLDYLGHFPCYKNMSLPMADAVTFQYINNDNERCVYETSDFNTFMNDMKAIKERYDTDEEGNGDLLMLIHLSNGAVDEINIAVIQYP